jgi:hypothetical protein
MTKDQVRNTLLQDIEDFRRKAKYYESIRLYEAAKYANSLASNIELALTTLPTDHDPEIS